MKKLSLQLQAATLSFNVIIQNLPYKQCGASSSVINYCHIISPWGFRTIGRGFNFDWTFLSNYEDLQIALHTIGITKTRRIQWQVSPKKEHQFASPKMPTKNGVSSSSKELKTQGQGFVPATSHLPETCTCSCFDINHLLHTFSIILQLLSL